MLRTFKRRHEAPRDYQEGDNEAKNWQTGWEFKLPPQLLQKVEDITGIKAQDPDKMFRLCVLSGYSKEQRTKVLEFAHKPVRSNRLVNVYKDKNDTYVVGEFFNDHFNMFSLVINNCNGDPASNPADKTKTLQCFKMTGNGFSTETPMRTYLVKI